MAQNDLAIEELELYIEEVEGDLEIDELLRMGPVGRPGRPGLPPESRQALADGVARARRELEVLRRAHPRPV